MLLVGCEIYSLGILVALNELLRNIPILSAGEGFAVPVFNGLGKTAQYVACPLLWWHIDGSWNWHGCFAPFESAIISTSCPLAATSNRKW